MLAKPSIFLQKKEDLIAFILEKGEAKFRAQQLGDWLFEKKVSDLGEMKNLSPKLKALLEEHYNWELPQIIERQDSKDGSTKLLIQGYKNQIFEMVIMRFASRVSLCLSTQVGCRQACSFCQTGKLGFFRNLSAEEIVSQYILANKILSSENLRVSNLVFMGMGEPLDNYEHLISSLDIFTSKSAHSLSKRKIVVSTSGLVPQILKLAKDNPVRLAISLHACNDQLRSKIMPINKRFSVSVLKQSLLEYQKNSQQRITIEYLLMKNLNDQIIHAKELVSFVHGLRTKVNLIPFNPHPGLNLSRPSNDSILSFQKYLSQRGLPAPIRYSKGSDISGACGQLAAKKIDHINSVPLRKNVISI